NETFAPGVIALGEDLVQTTPLVAQGHAELLRENRGVHEVVEDIRLVGSFSTEVENSCARCLEPVHNAVSEKFDLLYRPLGMDARSEEVSISKAETEIGYYLGDGLLLEDVLKEQLLLALPVKQVCRPDCKGICPQCGKDLNAGSCDCVTSMPDPRWSA